MGFVACTASYSPAIATFILSFLPQRRLHCFYIFLVHAFSPPPGTRSSYPPPFWRAEGEEQESGNPKTRLACQAGTSIRLSAVVRM